MGTAKEVVFQKNAASLDSIKKAAYRFIDQFSTEFLIHESVHICVLRFPLNKSEDSINLSIDNFRKEVLDQDLRASIRAETEAIRNLILAHAFSKTGLIQHE